jgi:hypothetical protein
MEQIARTIAEGFAIVLLIVVAIRIALIKPRESARKEGLD